MFEDQTPEVIKARMLENITRMDTREGGFADDMAGPIAVELSKMYASLNAMRYMVWVDETSGLYLDLAAEDLGMEPRKEGARAGVTLTLTGKAGYVMPETASFFTDEGLYFGLTEAVTIPEEGTLEVEARAVEVGMAYNVEAGAIRYSAGVDNRLESVTNVGAAMGGADPESDQSLFVRIQAYRRRPSTSGNEAHYEQWALEVDGVGAAKATGLWNGPGTVKVLIADQDCRPVDDAVVENCAAHIEEMRPVGPLVTVRSASAFPVNIAATLRLKGGADLREVTEAFRESLEGFFQSVSLLRFTVLYNLVGALLIATEGVIDYQDLTLNGVQGNLTLTDEQVPAVGEVVFQ